MKIEEEIIKAEMSWINGFIESGGITEENLREMAIEIIKSRMEK